ncbi:GNAT family N-acetyltransferase [Burkholderia sp. 22313]|uniref:GNAT family N-acetyltransferase n=1 Tax=Burkholderia sp. 22313 TaxID=3453908 RepID=UPI003F87F14D
MAEKSLGVAVDGLMHRADVAGDRLYLRPAQESDRAFLRTVFESTRIDEFVQAGLSADRIAVLLVEQFSMQDKYYRAHYPHCRFDVVMLGEHAIGRLYHDWRGSEVRMIDIALLPAHRGAGVGTRLVQAIVSQAAACAMPVVLYVEMNNPVRALYRRCGFEQTGENGIYLQMTRPAAPFDRANVRPVPGLAIEGAQAASSTDIRQ